MTTGWVARIEATFPCWTHLEPFGRIDWSEGLVFSAGCKTECRRIRIRAYRAFSGGLGCLGCLISFAIAYRQRFLFFFESPSPEVTSTWRGSDSTGRRTTPQPQFRMSPTRSSATASSSRCCCRRNSPTSSPGSTRWTDIPLPSLESSKPPELLRRCPRFASSSAVSLHGSRRHTTASFGIAGSSGAAPARSGATVPARLGLPPRCGP
jgi:hypothetical protein